MFSRDIAMTCITIHMEWDHNPQWMFYNDITIHREWHHNPEVTFHRVTSQSTMNVLHWHHNQIQWHPNPCGVTSQSRRNVLQTSQSMWSDITIHKECFTVTSQSTESDIIIHNECSSDITIHREWHYNPQGIFYSDITIHVECSTATLQWHVSQSIRS